MNIDPMHTMVMSAWQVFLIAFIAYILGLIWGKKML